MVEKIDINSKSEDDLFALMKTELFSAVIGDVMDKMGLTHQFLHPRIKPLGSSMIVLGRAMPVLEADVYEEVVNDSKNPIMKKSFGIMLEALDDLKKNEVYICTGSSPSYALWGELMSTRANILEAAGAVVNGYSRDTKGILNLNFPTFSYGAYAQDQGPRGKVIDFRVPIEIDGVRINPGDLVFGDLDGVCIIPQNFENKIIEKAFEKARGEKLVANSIKNGMGAKEAFDLYGIM